MKHILLIDKLENLVIKKDSSLLLALTLKKKGFETYLLFEKDFYIQNNDKLQYRVYDFEGDIDDTSFYINSFNCLQEHIIEPSNADTVHMRLDPPFDGKYLRNLWLLQFLESMGVNILNRPKSILLYNEKLYAYEKSKYSTQSYVGQDAVSFQAFVDKLKSRGVSSIILKPLDLYQGIGVVKIENNALAVKAFCEHVQKYNGPIIAQPFIAEVEKGEVRALYFKQEFLGAILKVPASGEYLANIARGAKYSAYTLSKNEDKMCREICQELALDGGDFIAFDILNGDLSEVNITCPGLLVEVSSALKENLAEKMINKF